MAYAVISTGGKQYRVQEGSRLSIEKIEAEEGSTTTFDQILLVGEGDSVRVGAPFVSGATVTAEVLKQGRAKKVIAFKFKRRKGYSRKKGHRQHITEIKVKSING